MNESWKFSDIPYTSPDVEALQTRYDALTRRARAAACPEDLLDVVRQRDALQQEVALCQSIATIRAFHGKTAGSLSVGGKSTYREPYLPLVQQVTHVEYGNADAMRTAIENLEAVGEKIARAAQLAQKKKLPLIIFCASRSAM